jgi:hypothetical protein
MTPPFIPLIAAPRNFQWGAEGDLWYQGPDGYWVSIPHPGVAGQALVSTEDGWETGTAAGGVSDNIAVVPWPIVVGHPAGAVLAVGNHILGMSNPHDGIILGWTLMTDATATVTVDLKSAAYADWPTTASVWGGTKPAVAAGRKASSGTLAIAIAAGDVWDVVIDANDAARQVVLNLLVLRDT